MTERIHSTIVGIRLDRKQGAGVICQVYGDGGLKTVYRVNRRGDLVGLGEIGEREAEAGRLAEESGLPLRIVSHDAPVPAHPTTASFSES